VPSPQREREGKAAQHAGRLCRAFMTKTEKTEKTETTEKTEYISAFQKQRRRSSWLILPLTPSSLMAGVPFR
jgi:hypothetical protein